MVRVKLPEAGPVLGAIMPAKDAVMAASKYYIEVTGLPFKGVSVEEVELTEDRRFWLVTLGLPQASLAGMLVSRDALDYKIFKVNSKTGQVLSMKIRNVK